ncbi:MAG TPA: pitrilysin family protein, partial [Bacilli bacterium]|nr:pitrilysin family protein [Bacilli bacterium]
MKKKKINGLDLEVYSEKLDNGLEIYIVPDNTVNNTYATYSTKYGGMHNDFIPYGEKEMFYSKKGIAHFLEHKMFEQEDESDVFKFFGDHGSNANANTSYYKTTYLFSGPNAFYENLEFLISYVEKPYFTDKNVEKEKGIIIEELEMYEDRPYSKLFSTCLYNTLVEHPIKYPVIGTVDSVNSITKEDLYACYNTFYHPSNMFIVVTGNVDPIKTIDIIKKHENKRKLVEEKEIVLKKYNEPDKVFKKEEIINMDITIPKVAIAYKINGSKIKNIDIHYLYKYIINSFDLKLGSTSLFTEKLRNANLITNCIDATGV